MELPNPGLVYDPPMEVNLKNENLWMPFYKAGTEMIITKAGRRMFPALDIYVKNLDPSAHYCVALEFHLTSHSRYRYSSTGGWTPAGTEEAQSIHRFYLHPESPSTGEYWMRQAISFNKIKLTNNPAPPPGQIVLSSMHKYQPVIVIAKTMDPRAMRWSVVSTHTFKETEFIAVTAYQNENITQLKIDNNPFAKGFREYGHSKTKKRKQTDQKTDKSPSKKHQNSQDEVKRTDSPRSSSSPELIISHPTYDYLPYNAYDVMPRPHYYYPYYHHNSYAMDLSHNQFNKASDVDNNNNNNNNNISKSRTYTNFTIDSILS